MRKHLLTWILSASVMAVSAQELTKKTLTFDEAVKIALQNGMLLNQQRNNLELNQIQKTSNILGLGPTLNVQANAFSVDGNTFNQNAGKVINGVFDQVNGSINANWNVFNGFQQINKVKQYNNLLDAQAFYVNRTAQDS